MKTQFTFLICALLLTACGGSGSGPASGSSNPIPSIGGTGGVGGGNQTSPVQLDSEEAAFVGLINAYRAQNGLGALQVSITLTEASKWMSQDQASHNYMDHTDSQGRDPGTRIEAFGYTQENAWGENVAAGNSTAQATFTQWKNSPPHNANMLGSSWKVMGVGRANNPSSNYGWYWTTDFGDFVDATLQ